MPRTTLMLLVTVLLAATASAERINHEGRILGPAPTVSTPTLFNTTQADAIVSAMQVFPVDNPWNEDVSSRPTHANSNAIISRIIADLDASRRHVRIFYEMNYVLVPNTQPEVAIDLWQYPGESDPSPYPIPSNMPVEGWPIDRPGLTNLEWQQDINDTGGDRHSIIVMPGDGLIWETWWTKLVGTDWQASNGAKFNLNSNALRQDGYTSGDAAGFPMFPALIRYDECQRGKIEHAMRLVVSKSRNTYVYPATHYASSLSDADLPPMGLRLRLKAGFSIPAAWTQESKVVAVALKKYGAMVADNGGFFSMSACPDDRFDYDCFFDLRSIPLTEFEVIQSTGPDEGPRSPGAPTADAGVDMTVSISDGASLAGAVTGSGLTVLWYEYDGPGDVTFASATSAVTTATFSQTGTYTLMLSARDGVHAVAYDAVVVTVDNSQPDAGTDAQFGSPSAGATLSGQITVAIQAHDPDVGTTDGDGIDGVDFELRRTTTTLDSHSDASAPFEWDIDTASYADDAYTIDAVVRSSAAAGGTSTTKSVSVTFSNAASADADGDVDGLPDWWESLYGLDPGADDSDGDGTLDGQEDEDLDDATNLEEYAAGTNPNVSDAPSEATGGGGLSCGAGQASTFTWAIMLALAAAARATRHRRPSTA